MAGAYVAETLQWRGNCLGYMNFWFGARRIVKNLEWKRGVIAALVPFIPRNSEGR